MNSRACVAALICALLIPLIVSTAQPSAPSSPTSVIKADDVLVVAKTEDFTLTGDGSSASWTKVNWNPLVKLDPGGSEYVTRFKILYSTTGLYILFEGDDDKITTKDYQDFEPIFHGDVFEIFLHPDPKVMVYFEYEVNALDKELVLAISNLNGHHSSWMPFGKSKSGIKKTG